MINDIKTHVFFLALTMLMSFMPATGLAAEAGESGQGELVDEMIGLNIAFRDVVTGVVLRDGAAVHNAIMPLHGLREKTEEGLKSGGVSLPKNQSRIAEFKKLDGDFHAELESLDEAARGNDANKMLLITKKLLDGCVRCHQVFRK